MVDHARIGSWNMFSIVRTGFRTIILNQYYENGTNVKDKSNNHQHIRWTNFTQMIHRFIIAKFLEAIGAILGIVLFPIVYACRHLIDRNVWYVKPLWYLSNQDEPNHLENWYGFYELMPEAYDIQFVYNQMTPWQRFKMSFVWVALRNPSWQLKLAIGSGIQCEPSNIKIYVSDGDHGGMIWRNKWITGKQYATFYLCGKKCFRYSWTRRIMGKWVNLMLGAKPGRYVSKFRVFDELGRWG